MAEKIDGKKFLKKVFESQDQIKTLQDIADLLRRTHSVVSNWSQRRSIPYIRCQEIAEKLGLDLHTLLNGGSADIGIAYYGDSPVSAGAGAFALSEEPTAKFKTVNELVGFFLEKDVDKMIAFSVKGDSMHPALKHGDSIIVSETEDFTKEGIYVVRYEGHLYIKRLVKTDKGYLLKSDNPEYDDIKASEKDDFAIIGKVLQVLHNV